MNILFVHEVDWINKVIYDVHFLSEALSVLGHEVFVIDYEDTWSRATAGDLGSLSTRRFEPLSRSIPGSSVRVRRPGFIKVPGLSRVTAAGTHFLEIRKTIREQRIDAVVLYSVPTNGLQTIYWCWRYDIPVIFRAIDMLYVLVDYPILKTATRWLEKAVYHRVDMILPNTPRYLEYVAGLGVPRSRLRLLKFPVDTELFQPVSTVPGLRARWGLGDQDKVIVFVGTLFHFSGLDTFIREFPRVIDAFPEARLLIVGDGPQRAELEGIIAGLGLEGKVVITGFQPYRTMPQYISLATVCINTFVINATTRDIFPSKIAQYVACGRATVATNLRGISTMLPGESHGVVYTDSVEGVADGVISLLQSEERRLRIEKAGIAYLRENHGMESVGRELEKIIEELIEEKQHVTAARS